MRRLLIALILVLTLGAVVAPAAPAVAQDNASQFCTEIAPILDLIFGTDISHGACVAFLQAGNLTPGIASLCRNEEVQEAVADFADVRENHGQCVKVLKALVGEL
jgi:hypothetical protein